MFVLAVPPELLSPTLVYVKVVTAVWPWPQCNPLSQEGEGGPAIKQKGILDPWVGAQNVPLAETGFDTLFLFPAFGVVPPLVTQWHSALSVPESAMRDCCPAPAKEPSTISAPELVMQALLTVNFEASTGAPRRVRRESDK
jgi:hypothetical protein